MGHRLLGHECCAMLSHLVMSNSLQSQELEPARLLCPWASPGKNAGVGCHALLQGIFSTQRSNPGLPHYRQILYCLSHQGSPFPWLCCVYSLITFALSTDIMRKARGAGHRRIPRVNRLLAQRFLIRSLNVKEKRKKITSLFAITSG